MNDKVKSSSNSAVTINMNELDDLENDLNELSSMNMKPDLKTVDTKSSMSFGSNFLDLGIMEVMLKTLMKLKQIQI